MYLTSHYTMETGTTNYEVIEEDEFGGGALCEMLQRQICSAKNNNLMFMEISILQVL